MNGMNGWKISGRAATAIYQDYQIKIWEATPIQVTEYADQLGHCVTATQLRYTVAQLPPGLELGIIAVLSREGFPDHVNYVTTDMEMPHPMDLDCFTAYFTPQAVCEIARNTPSSAPIPAWEIEDGVAYATVGKFKISVRRETSKELNERFGTTLHFIDAEYQAEYQASYEAETKDESSDASQQKNLVSVFESTGQGKLVIDLTGASIPTKEGGQIPLNGATLEEFCRIVDPLMLLQVAKQTIK